jgi:hypothetical protein
LGVLAKRRWWGHLDAQVDVPVGKIDEIVYQSAAVIIVGNNVLRDSDSEKELVVVRDRTVGSQFGKPKRRAKVGRCSNQPVC